MLNKTQIREVQKLISNTNKKLPIIFGVLSDVGRFRIFKLLMGHKELCVTDIANVFRVSVPAASQQLKIMEMSELIVKERMGQMICYSINMERPFVKSIIKLIEKLDV